MVPQGHRRQVHPGVELSPLALVFLAAFFAIVVVQYGLLWHWGRPPYNVRLRFTRFRTRTGARWGLVALALVLVALVTLTALVVVAAWDTSAFVLVWVAALMLGPTSKVATQVVFRPEGLRIQLSRFRYNEVYVYFADDVICFNRVSDSSELAKIPYRVLPEARARELAEEFGIRIS